MALTKSKKDILILYNGSDAEEWKRYLCELINAGLEDIQCEWKNVMDGVPGNIVAMSRQFFLLAIFVSPKMLDTLELDPNKDALTEFIDAHKHIAVIRLGISEDDVMSVVQSEYNNTVDWKMLEINSNEKDNQKMISQLMNRLQEARPPTPLSKPKKSDDRQPSLKTIKSSNVVKAVSPEKVKIVGEQIMLVFHKGYEQETVQVAFDKDECSKIDTTRLNPFCYQFKAPAHKPGHAKLYVYIDGKKVSRLTLKYMSPSKFAYTIPEYLCQVLNINPDVDENNLNNLDKALAQIFNASLPGDCSLDYILSPKHVSDSTGGKKSEDFLPTLLHFACYYGLQDLCSSVMDTPGSAFAFEIRNCDNQSPLELAREAKHEDLVEYIEAFLEMQNYIGVCGDIYEKMTQQSLGDGYLYMKSLNKDIVEEYDTGRVHVPEDDYILTDNNKPGGVEEVCEAEDVRETEYPKPEVPDRSTKPKPAHKNPPDKTKLLEDPPHSKDEEFFKPIPLSPLAMGSTNMAELIEYQEMYKEKVLDIGDIEKLYGAWIQRNKNNLTSSLKERKENIDKMKKEFCRPELKKRQKKSFFSKSWKKTDSFELDIQHHVTPNIYIGMPDDTNRNRDSLGSNRDSVNSLASVTSSSSSDSRGSNLVQIPEFNSSDSEPDEMAPPVPIRDNKNGNVSQEKRKSLGDTFLDNIGSQIRPTRTTRLPPVPSHRPSIRKSSMSGSAPPKRPERRN